MGFKILVVDDSKVTRLMIGRTLELTKIPIDELHEAANGQEGLDALRAHTVDVVIADINMPVMNGMEMIERIKAESAMRAIPIVVISTEGSTTRIDELRALGIKAYVRKPFTPEGIRDSLKEVLGDWDEEAGERTA